VSILPSVTLGWNLVSENLKFQRLKSIVISQTGRWFGCLFRRKSQISKKISIFILYNYFLIYLIFHKLTCNLIDQNMRFSYFIKYIYIGKVHFSFFKEVLRPSIPLVWEDGSLSHSILRLKLDKTLPDTHCSFEYGECAVADSWQ
jgi:hypothetical protein